MPEVSKSGSGTKNFFNASVTKNRSRWRNFYETAAEIYSVANDLCSSIRTRDRCRSPYMSNYPKRHIVVDRPAL